jgi:hypothetical protein
MENFGESTQPVSPIPVGLSEPIQAELAAPRKSSQPTGLLVICVVAMALGGMGVLAAMGQVLNLATGGGVQNVWSSVGTAGLPADVRDSQNRMFSSIQDLVSRYALVQGGFGLVQFAIAGALAYGGFYSMMLRPRGRQVLLWSLWCAVPFEIARAVPATMLQMEMTSIMEEGMATMFAEDGDPTGIGTAMAKFSVYLGIAISLVWGIAKIGYYVASAMYLSRPTIRSLFVFPPGE